ncbi:Glutamate receptor 3.4 [Linum perenne]
MYSKKSLFFLFLLFFSSKSNGETKIGILIDTTTRIGREQNIAIQLAARDQLNLNASSLRFRDYNSRNPGNLLRAAEHLIGEEGSEAMRREKVYSNLTRVVLVVWLFVVLILNSSYTANLSSMLTVLRLQPNSNDIDWLKKKNLKIGWDGNPFVKDYLQNVLNFKVENIKKVDSEYKYEREFDANNISAAFLEIPYQKEFINHYCRRFTAMAQPFNRFGGFGFVFQKGSPIAADVSMAILKLSEDGELQRLEDHWFATPRECLDIESDHATESLSLQNFWGLYVVTGATSTICLMVFLVQLLKCKLSQEEGREDLTVWNKIIKLAKYIYNGKDYEERGSLSTAPGVEEWSSPRSSWECESPHPQVPDDPRIPAPAAV